MTTAIQSIDSTTTAISIGGVEAFRFTANNFTNLNTASLNGGQLAGFRNRIINGDMRIDQRNNGAAVTLTSAGTGTVDRWMLGMGQPSKLTTQRNAGAIAPPPGFSNYVGVTTASAYTAASTENFMLYQGVEGFNISDFAWGTAYAKKVVVSFFVYSSLTGTFSGALSNNSRSYPFTYAVAAPNTWTYVVVPIAGDTSGTWATDSTLGVYVLFDLGSGSTKRGVAGSWSASTAYGATGSVSMIGTLGATFYVTGVQLELGNVATPFERRFYGTEFALCQRYYQTHVVTGYGEFAMAQAYNTAVAYGNVRFETTMRAPPTLAQLGTAFRLGGEAVGSFSWDSAGTTGFVFHCSNTTTAFVTGNAVLLIQDSAPTNPIWTALSEL